MADHRPHWLSPVAQMVAHVGYAFAGLLFVTLVLLLLAWNGRGAAVCDYRWRHALSISDSLSVTRECGEGRAKP